MIIITRGTKEPEVLKQIMGAIGVLPEDFELEGSRCFKGYPTSCYLRFSKKDGRDCVTVFDEDAQGKSTVIESIYLEDILEIQQTGLSESEVPKSQAMKMVGDAFANGFVWLKNIRTKEKLYFRKESFTEFSLRTASEEKVFQAGNPVDISVLKVRTGEYSVQGSAELPEDYPKWAAVMPTGLDKAKDALDAELKHVLSHRYIWVEEKDRKSNKYVFENNTLSNNSRRLLYTHTGESTGITTTVEKTLLSVLKQDNKVVRYSNEYADVSYFWEKDYWVNPRLTLSLQDLVDMFGPTGTENLVIRHKSWGLNETGKVRSLLSRTSSKVMGTEYELTVCKIGGTFFEPNKDKAYCFTSGDDQSFEKCFEVIKPEVRL